jgi:transcriptional regulator with XRE-family HTH domain
LYITSLLRNVHDEPGIVNSTSITRRDAATVALNLRRHMAQAGMTYEDVVSATELDERTIRGLARGTTNPHSKTLHKLAQGLSIEIGDLFRSPGLHSPRRFDRATNTLVREVVTANAYPFQNWSDSDFDELFSRFGTGGQLTEAGVLAAAEEMNEKRDLWRQVGVIMESGEAKLLTDFVELLYRRATAAPVAAD